ncbi:MAG TPA: nucleoside triphosphate pyrophosphohydrolase [Fimbriimonadaceae bacterium]|nr:nucleoside triphosphate pyrophosphohydrolase [Fimbriimonadaceae bacterium]
MRALEILGLQGAYQVHVAPHVLRADHRAHQVFTGFSDLGELASAVLRQYPGDAKSWLLDGDESRPITLAEILESPSSPPLGGGLGRGCEQSKSLVPKSHFLAPREGDCDPDEIGRTGGRVEKSLEHAILVIPAISDENPGNLYGLVWVVDRLLGPGGCPWDQEQTHESLKRHLIEEAYELIQAIDDNNGSSMKEELGDVLLQPIMHAQMEAIEGRWDTDEVARTVTEKLIRRHPHVFPPSGGRRSVGAQSEPDYQNITTDEVLHNWDMIKKEEKGTHSVLDGVPKAMPALLRAYEVSKRAARNGFEWPDREAVWDKLHEEERELRAALEGQDQEEVEAEVGDLLFTAVNIARWAGIEPEDALRTMLDRFTNRFQAMERASYKPLNELDPEEWDKLWEEAKDTLNQERLI